MSHCNLISYVNIQPEQAPHSHLGPKSLGRFLMRKSSSCLPCQDSLHLQLTASPGLVYEESCSQGQDQEEPATEPGNF